MPLSGPFAAALLDAVSARAEVVTHEAQRGASVRAELQHRLDRWYARRRAVQTGRLGYKEAPDVNGLLREPDEGSWDLWVRADVHARGRGGDPAAARPGRPQRR